MCKVRLDKNSVILNEVKDLLFRRISEKSRSFTSFRMTLLTEEQYFCLELTPYFL